MNILERIAARKKNRVEIDHKAGIILDGISVTNALLLISESLDDYIEHRIETDKVLIGVLKDIQGNMAAMTDLDRVTKN